MLNLKNKKAFDLAGVLIFLLLNLVFFASMLIFVARAGSDDAVIEKKEVRRIALAIDEIAENSEITINIEEILEAAKKNRFEGGIIMVDYENSKITLKVSSGEGNSFYFFRNLEDGNVLINKNDKTMTVRT